LRAREQRLGLVGQDAGPLRSEVCSRGRCHYGEGGVDCRDDPYLIGYFVDNELAWGRGEAADPQLRDGLATHTMRLGKAGPAKHAFIDQLVAKYRNVEDLATAWGIVARSWDELRDMDLPLSSANLGRPAVTEDLRAFTALFAETYFRIVSEAVR